MDDKDHTKSAIITWGIMFAAMVIVGAFLFSAGIVIFLKIFTGTVITITLGIAGFIGVKAYLAFTESKKENPAEQFMPYLKEELANNEVFKAYKVILASFREDINFRSAFEFIRNFLEDRWFAVTDALTEYREKKKVKSTDKPSS